ncbi:MAG TPA: DUF2993 domain-containing protein [Mycobacteriales bacterium]
MATRAGPVRRRRPGRSTTAAALAVVLGTAALVWGIGGLTRIGAESLLARVAQQDTGVTQLPAVRVRGGFLLDDLVRGRYGDVEVRLPAAESGPLRLTAVQVRLQGASMPFHDMLVRDAHHVLVDRGTAEAVLTWADLDRYLRLTSRPVTADPVSDSVVRLTGSVRVGGRTVAASAEATLTATADGLALRPSRLDPSGPGLDGASALLLRQRLTVLVPMQALPFGLQVTGVTVRDDGLHLRAAGTGLLLQD